MEKILITGGLGYVGGLLTRRLQETDYDITITTSRKEINKAKSILSIRYMDLLDEASVREACKDVDAVVHAATFDERMIRDYPKDALLVNTYGTKLLLDSAVSSGVKKFIYLSTVHVYGKSTGIITESSLTTPTTDYGMTHLFAELYCKQFATGADMDVIVTRSANGVGLPTSSDIDRWYLAVNDFCRMAFNEQRITIRTDGLQFRDFICIKDVVKGIELLLKKDSIPNHFEIFNISSEKTISIRELAYLISSIYQDRFGQKVIVDIPLNSNNTNRISNNLFIDSGKLRKLGWEPDYSIRDAINEVFDYLEISGGLRHE